MAERNGYVRMIEEAGGVVMSDTCPAISRHLPKGVRTFATDFGQAGALSAGDQGVQAWFGSVRDCVEAAITGTWNGRPAMSDAAPRRTIVLHGRRWSAAAPRARRW